jgi:exodeoxyribonuclease-1
VAGIKDRLFKKVAELKDLGLERLGLTTIKANQCEIIADLNENGVLLDTFAIDKKALRENLDRIRAHEAFIKEKLKEVFTHEQVAEDKDSDLMIYAGGFFSKQEKDEMKRFHSFAERGNLSDYSCALSLSRLPEMVFKIKARNFPETLDAEENLRWKSYIKQRISDGTLGAEITLENYPTEMKLAREKNKEPLQQMVLDEIDEYVEGLRATYVR